MTDRIFIENLRVTSRVGITPEERRKPQEVLLDVSLFLSLANAGSRDDIEASIDYKKAMSLVSGIVSDGQFVLLEGLAEKLARELLGSFPAEMVRVRARKAQYSGEPSVGIEVERVREKRSSRS